MNHPFRHKINHLKLRLSLDLKLIKHSPIYQKYIHFNQNKLQSQKQEILALKSQNSQFKTEIQSVKVKFIS